MKGNHRKFQKLKNPYLMGNKKKPSYKWNQERNFDEMSKIKVPLKTYFTDLYLPFTDD